MVHGRSARRPQGRRCHRPGCAGVLVGAPLRTAVRPHSEGNRTDEGRSVRGQWAHWTTPNPTGTRRGPRRGCVHPPPERLPDQARAPRRCGWRGPGFSRRRFGDRRDRRGALHPRRALRQDTDHRLANIIAGMHGAGIKRLVCLSSSAVGPHPEPLGGFIFEKIMQPYVVNKLG
jgi:hypothetical protein